MHEIATMPYRRRSRSRPRWPRPDRTSDDRPRLARGCRGTRVKSIAGSRGRATHSLRLSWLVCPTTLATDLPAPRPLPPEGLDAGPTTSSEPGMLPRTC